VQGVQEEHRAAVSGQQQEVIIGRLHGDGGRRGAVHVHADDFAACALPPLMDVSGGSGANMSLPVAAAAASIELTPTAPAPAPAPHVTCFSNALEGHFLTPPPCLLPSAAAAATDHVALAASASPFLASMVQYDGDAGVGGMVHELLQEAGGWYSKLGERERHGALIPTARGN